MKTQEECSRESRKNKKNLTKTDYFQQTLEESGLKLNEPPNKSYASHDTVIIVRNLKKNLQKHIDYPHNINIFYSDLEKRCIELTIFKHYLYPNIVRETNENSVEFSTNYSLFKILLCLPFCQNKLIDYIFGKAFTLTTGSHSIQWIKMILKCFSTLDHITDMNKMAENLINLLEVTEEKMVQLEIITAIPDIIGDQAHDTIISEMSRILSEDYELIPAILDCLSYLCLSKEQYEILQNETLRILKTLSRCNHFPIFVKFLLMPGHSCDSDYLKIVEGIRNALGWSTSIDSIQDIASSQILTASAIRNSVISSKLIANAWFKLISNCQLSSDHLPFDLIILIILYSTTEEKQKQIENIVRKQVKLNILNEELLDDAFKKFSPILKDYLKHLITITNSLLKNQAEPLIQQFASHIYSLMFSKIGDCCQTIAAELLQLGLDNKQSVTNMLTILNNVVEEDISILKPHSVQMLTLLDRMDDMSLSEIEAVMNLLCGLAYTYDNSVIRDDIHIIIRKELGSSNSAVKIQGILAGVHAVKYLMRSNSHEEIELTDDCIGSTDHLPEGDIKEAAQIVELISHSTKQFPELMAFFYDSLFKIVLSKYYINKILLHWLTESLTNDLQQNFIVDAIEFETIKELKLEMQYCINSDSEMGEIIAINIAGLTLQDKQIVSIIVLSPLFQLVQALHMRKNNGDLSSIDALLGCPIIMPLFDIDLIENMSNYTISNIIDCHVHCVNWFRELLNAFASQNDKALKSKMYNRILDLKRVESVIGEILLKTNIVYKAPSYVYNSNNFKLNADLEKKQGTIKNKSQVHDDSNLPQTLKSQGNISNIMLKTKLSNIHNISFRPFSLELLNLLDGKLTQKEETNMNMTIEILTFLLKCVNYNLENTLISKIKRITFLSREEHVKPYDRLKAEKYAEKVDKVLPTVMEHLKFITDIMDDELTKVDDDAHERLRDNTVIDCIAGLENIYNMCTIYFKWIGFKSQHKALLKNSLHTVSYMESRSGIYMQDLLLSVAKLLQSHDKYCIQLSIAVSLFDFLKVIQEYTSSPTIIKILRDLAKKFVIKQWKTADGIIEKGFILNQSIDNFAREYFVHSEISELKNITNIINNDIQKILKQPKSYLDSFQTINRTNFYILYKNLGKALQMSTRIHLSKGLTNSEHLEVWKDIILILTNMTEMAKSLDSRNNLTAFFRSSLPIIKFFISHGMPILEIEFKNNSHKILELLKILQKCTRFLQFLCCHSRLKKDTALINKVPFVKQLLETHLYKVKALLAANNCSEAFWMGSLKIKNIHGEVIESQELLDNEESLEDCDEQLPDDDDETDNEILNPDLGSASDMV